MSAPTRPTTRSCARTKPSTSKPKSGPCEMSSPTNPTTNIDDLPPEMICELFEYLRPKDLAVCSTVNKRWHSIYAGFKVHRLVVVNDFGHLRSSRRLSNSQDDARCVLSKWCHSDQTIADQDLCTPAMFSRLVDRPLLSNLKRLALCGHTFEFDLNQLSNFGQLVHLEFNIRWLGEKMNLNLPRLQVLAFHSFNEHCPLSIDCPKLSSLVYSGEPKDANLLQVKQPETIRKLEMGMGGAKLAPFKNVECLLTDEFGAISKATLLSLPKLKELRYNASIETSVDFDFNNEAGSLDQMKRALREFLDDVKVLRGTDFQFTFVGFRLTKSTLDQIDFGVHVDERSGDETVCNEYVYLKNYQLIEPGALDFICEANYTRLMSNVSGEFPSCFSKKFTGIQKVCARGTPVQDAAHFLWFLKSLRSLRSLRLNQPGLSQAFYDQLPASAHSLTEFYLYEHRPSELQLVNFDFIARLTHLSWFAFDRELSLELLSSLVRSLGKLAEGVFAFQFKGGNEIGKSRDSKVWKLLRDVYSKRPSCHSSWIGRRTSIKTEHPEEIVNYFERLQKRLEKTPPSEPKRKKPRNAR